MPQPQKRTPGAMRYCDGCGNPLDGQTDLYCQKCLSVEVNLWELLTHAAACHDMPASIREKLNKALAALAAVAPFGGAEISIAATPDGWRVEVFSCYGGGDRHREPPTDSVGDAEFADPRATMLVPKARSEAIPALEVRDWR